MAGNLIGLKTWNKDKKRNGKIAKNSTFEKLWDRSINIWAIIFFGSNNGFLGYILPFIKEVSTSTCACWLKLLLRVEERIDGNFFNNGCFSLPPHPFLLVSLLLHFYVVKFYRHWYFYIMLIFLNEVLLSICRSIFFFKL